MKPARWCILRRAGPGRSIRLWVVRGVMWLQRPPARLRQNRRLRQAIPVKTPGARLAVLPRATP